MANTARARSLPGRAVAVLLGIAAAVATVTPAQAAPNSATAIQLQVDAYRAKHPGGVQVGAADIAYDEGRFVVTIARTSGTALSGADCPSGWYCFYDGINFAYPRGRLSDCGYQDLGTWGWRNRTESAAYNFNTGSVTFVDTATYTNLFTVSTTVRSNANVGAGRNRADTVYRNC